MKKGDKSQYRVRGVQKRLLKAKGCATDVVGKATSAIAACEKPTLVDHSRG